MDLISGGTLSAEQLSAQLAFGYDAAFDGVVWLLFAAVLVLTFLVSVLIRNGLAEAKPQTVEPAEERPLN